MLYFPCHERTGAPWMCLADGGTIKERDHCAHTKQQTNDLWQRQFWDHTSAISSAYMETLKCPAASPLFPKRTVLSCCL